MTPMRCLTRQRKAPSVALKAVLGPLLLVQGLWVRMRTPLLPEADGPRRGRFGHGPLLHLLVLGDSSAAGVGVSSQPEALLGRLTRALGRDHTVAYRLVARTGATTADALDFLARADIGPQDVVVTALGVNDLTAGRPISAWLADQQRLIDIVRERLNPRVILVSGLPPVHRFPALPQPLRWYLGLGARAFSAALAELARCADVLFLPLDFTLDVSQMATDGFHPGAGVYREWGRRAALAIRERLAASPVDNPSGHRDMGGPNEALEETMRTGTICLAMPDGPPDPGKEDEQCPNC